MKTRFVEDCLALDIRAFEITPDIHQIRIEGGHVAVYWETYLLGKRAWFICLDCGRRRRFLYEHEKRWTCRTCQKLMYRSQWSNKWYQFVQKERRLFEAVKHGKPKWKHRRKYDALMMELWAVQSVLNAAMVARLSGMKQFIVRKATRQVIHEMKKVK